MTRFRLLGHSLLNSLGNIWGRAGQTLWLLAEEESQKGEVFLEHLSRCWLGVMASREEKLGFRCWRLWVAWGSWPQTL